MSELQKRQSELEMELTEATKKECTTKMEVEKLENELGMKTEEITEGKNKIEEIEREANQIKAQIDEIKNDLDLKGLYFFALSHQHVGTILKDPSDNFPLLVRDLLWSMENRPSLSK